ncbi:JAB domain-containing protein [Sporomusa sp. KB1]
MPRLVHPRELFKKALFHNAAAVIIGHNHPSSNPLPMKTY